MINKILPILTSLLLTSCFIQKKVWDFKYVSPTAGQVFTGTQTIDAWGTFFLRKAKLSKKEKEELKREYESLSKKEQKKLKKQYKEFKKSGNGNNFLDWLNGRPDLSKGFIYCNGKRGQIWDRGNSGSWKVTGLELVEGENKIRCAFTDENGTITRIRTVFYENENKLPVAIIHTDVTSGFFPLSVSFDGSSSYDPDGNIVSYKWTFPDGTISTGAQTQYVFSSAGSFDVTLTVTDNEGLSRSIDTSISVTQDQVKPSLTFDPESGTEFITSTPLITVNFSDSGVGIDPSSFKLVLDGVDITSKLQISQNEALLQFTNAFPFTDGDHTLLASIKDRHNNESTQTIGYKVTLPNIPSQGHITGLVLDSSGDPLSMANVSILNGPIYAWRNVRTGLDGRYNLPINISGNYKIRITKTGYTSSTKPVENVIQQRDTLAPTATLMDADPLITMVPAPTGGTATNSTGTVTLIVPPGSLDQDTNMSMTEATVGEGLEIDLPELSEFTYAVDHQPSGTQFNTPVTIELDNILNLPVGTPIPLGITDEALGVWTDAGTIAQVSPDGSKIVYQLDHFSTSDANVGGITMAGVTPDTEESNSAGEEGDQDDSTGGGSNPTTADSSDSTSSDSVANSGSTNCPKPNGTSVTVASIIRNARCSLSTGFKLPSVKRLSQNYNLSFRYHSTSAKPSVVVETLNNQDHPIYRIPVELKVNIRLSGQNQIIRYEGRSNLKPSVLRGILEAKNADGNFLQTGSYVASIETTAIHDDGEFATAPYFGAPPQTSIGVPTRDLIELKENINTRVVVQNERTSPFGAGWTMSGLEKIHFDPEGTLVITNGSGDARVFSPTPFAKNYSKLRINNEKNISHAIYHDGFVWATSCADNAIYRVSLKGEMKKIASLNCPKLITPSRKGGFFVTMNDGNEIQYLDLKAKEDKKLKSLYKSSSEIKKLLEDNILALHFIEDNMIKTVSPRDGSIIEMVGPGAILDVDLVSPSDVLVDAYGNFIIVDTGANKICKVYPKTREVKDLIGGEEYLEKRKKRKKFDINMPILQAPKSLTWDSNLKRYFILEESGRILMWKGRGHHTLRVMSQEEGELKTFRGHQLNKDYKPKDSLAFSPEIGLIMVENSALIMSRLGNVEKNQLTQVNYFSDNGEFSQLVRLTDGTYRRTFKNQTVTLYNSQGEVTSITEEDGITTSFEYINGKLSKVILPTTEEFLLTYDNRGYLEKIIDPLGRETILTISSTGTLTQVTFPDSSKYQYEYDADKLLTKKIDKLNREKTFEYSFGRIVKQTYEGGRVRNIIPAALVGYDANKVKNNELLEQISPEDVNSTFISPEGVESKIEIDEFGMERSREFATGLSSTIYRNAEGRATSINSPEGRYQLLEYDVRGNLTKSVSGAGERNYTYTFDNKLTQVDYPNGTNEKYQYNNQGLISSYTDRMGKITTFEYFTNGVLKKITNALGEAFEYEIDAQGNVTALIDNIGNRTEYTRNSDGYVIQVKDPNNNITQMVRDVENRVIETTTALGGVTKISYLDDGRISTIEDARQGITTFEYNDQMRLSKRTDQSGLFEEFFYDDDARLVKKRQKNGDEIDFAYDNDSRLISKTTSDNVTQYYYDGDGILVKVTDNDSQVDFIFDKFGRLISEKQDTFPFFDLRYSYDEEGYIQNFQFGNYLSESFARFSDKTLEVQHASHFGQSVRRYTGRDDLRRINYVDSGFFTITQNITYDTNSRLSSMSTVNNLNETLLSLAYTYDPNSNIVGISENLSGTNYNHTYVVDAENRITNANSYTNEVFNMDILGNILNNGGIYNSRNHLVENNDYFFTYSDNGNLIVQSNKLGAKVTEYDWDVENRLVELREKADGTNISLKIEYKYDGLNRRTQRIVTDNVTTSNSSHVKYIYNGVDVILETNGQGALMASYMMAEGVDSIFAMFKDLNNDQLLSADESFYFLKDHLNSTKQLLKRDGSVVQSYKYSTYGESTVEVAAGETEVKNSRTYTGREQELEVPCLYYYRARYYNSCTGRFISEDPVGFRGGDFNLYRYVRNTSISSADPYGLNTINFSKLEGGGGSGGGSAVALGAGTSFFAGITLNKIFDAISNVFRHQEEDVVGDIDTAQDDFIETLIDGGASDFEVSGDTLIGELLNGDKIILYPESTSTGGPTISTQGSNGKTKKKKRFRCE